MQIQTSTKLTETAGFFTGLVLGILIGWHLFMFYFLCPWGAP